MSGYGLTGVFGSVAYSQQDPKVALLAALSFCVAQGLRTHTAHTKKYLAVAALSAVGYVGLDYMDDFGSTRGAVNSVFERQII